MALTDISQPIHLGPGEGDQVRVFTDLVTIKAAASDTGGTYFLFESVTPPSGGVPPHAQRLDDETFYVTEGRYAFLIGEKQLELGPGEYAFVPRGTVHGFTNVGSTDARLLVLLTPGGIHEEFFDEISDQRDRPPWDLDMSKVLAVAPKYGVEFFQDEAPNLNTSDRT